VPVSDETLSPHPPDLRHIRTHGVEALDATGRDDGARHASSRLGHEGQVKGHQGDIWAQVVAGDGLCPRSPDIPDLLIAHRQGKEGDQLIGRLLRSAGACSTLWLASGKRHLTRSR
jgi:hypothetical protein